MAENLIKNRIIPVLYAVVVAGVFRGNYPVPDLFAVPSISVSVFLALENARHVILMERVSHTESKPFALYWF